MYGGKSAVFEPVGVVSLRVSRTDARRQIEVRLAVGDELQKRQSVSAEDLAALRADGERWHDFNVALIATLLSNVDDINELPRFLPASWNDHDSVVERAERWQRVIARDMNALRGLQERLALYPEPIASSDVAVGSAATEATGALRLDLHVAVAPIAVLLDRPDTAARDAWHTVEVRVRALGSLPDRLVGVDLMTQAFRDGGPLRDPNMHLGEALGFQNLFQGVFGALRNPVTHRNVDHGRSHVLEVLALTSLLHRHLDDVEKRLAGQR